ncbi:hypothetical protein [Adhaeretor mobilis]|uniref:Chromosome partition protein Smc n=1 Tax=Adhaeretor mobilis TaxID=1930276 RepID=A0A517MRJ5_9BACT|nr:hypothetical protein [Adhaeretor mobilis]QDS97486.1 Chromosome partition protein Smc [Adhaeretor mobilis]
MDQIYQQVARARARLNRELFVKRLLWCWFASFTLGVFALAVPKVVAIEGLPSDYVIWCIAGAAGLGLIAATLWMLLTRKTDLDAAIEIDSRYDLRERVASSLSLPEQSLNSPAGQALVGDAVRAVQRVEVDERFRMSLGRKAWLPLVPALLGLAVTMFFDNQIAQSNVTPPSTELTKQAQENLAKTRKRLEERRKKAAEAGLKDAEELFRQLEKESKELEAAGEKKEGRKKAMVKLNDLAKQLEKRQEKVGGQKEMQKQLNQMKDFNKGPADKLADAMKKGDWKKAQDELKKLAEKVKNGKLDENAKKQLQEQMKQMQERLANAADAQKKAQDQLKQQIEQAKREGNTAEAGKMQQQLDKMQKQAQANQQMQKMAQQMAEAQKAMEKGDQQAAGEAMDKMMEQMEQMKAQMAEGELLDAMMDDLQMAKDALGCQQCQGEGCQECNGGGGEGGENPQDSQNANGKGPGGGTRPDTKNDVRFRDSRVRQNVGKGAAVLAGEADGPNIRGEVVEQMKAEMSSQGSEPADPMVLEQLPKSRRDHAEEYFNTLREGR